MHISETAHNSYETYCVFWTLFNAVLKRVWNSLKLAVFVWGLFMAVISPVWNCLNQFCHVLFCLVPLFDLLWNSSETYTHEFWNLLLLLKPIYSFSETALKLCEPILTLDLLFETCLTLLRTLCVTLWNNSETCLLFLELPRICSGQFLKLYDNPSWTFHLCLKLVWTCSEACPTDLKLSEIIWNYMKHSEIFWNYKRPCHTVWIFIWCKSAWIWHILKLAETCLCLTWYNSEICWNNLKPCLK